MHYAPLTVTDLILHKFEQDENSVDHSTPIDLFLSGLTESTGTREYISELFGKFGEIIDISPFFHGKQFLGMATVRFADPGAAKMAFKTMKDKAQGGMKIQLDSTGI